MVHKFEVLPKEEVLNNRCNAYEFINFDKDIKQTAVEWLCEQYHLKQDIEIVNQAKEMEKQQQDKFAIGFAEWLLIIYNEDIIYDAYSKEELLEIYKNENNL